MFLYIKYIFDWRIFMKKFILSMFLMICAMFALNKPVTCEARDGLFLNTVEELKKWNPKETYQVQMDDITYKAILSLDKTEAWIYRADTTTETKKVVFPDMIEGVPVTKVGYDFTIIQDGNPLMKETVNPDNISTEEDYKDFLNNHCCDSNYISVFGVLAEGYHDLYGYADRIKNIKKMVLPSHLNWIVPGAFSGMRKLEEIVIPDGVSIITSEAFADCRNLKKVHLPASLDKENIYEFYDAFPNCKNLRSISISKDNEHYKIKDNLLLSKDGKELYAAVSLDKELKIPDNITTIKPYALKYCKAEKLYIGKKLKKIEKNALYSRKIKEIIIDKKNKYFKSYDQYVLNMKDKSVVVYILNGEATLRFSKDVKKLTDNYSVCGKKEYKKVIIPKSVKKFVGHCYIFGSDTKIYFESKTPPKQIMKNIDEMRKILPWAENVYVPKNSRKAYKEWYEQIENGKIYKDDIIEYK